MKKIYLYIFVLYISLYANEAVVYSAAKSKQNIKDTTTNMYIITSVEIKEKNINTLLEAINLAIGISFTQDGGIGQTASIKIRGSHQKHTLVLIDGIRYNDITTLTATAFIQNLIVDDIEQIEIIKGAQSGIWGADASGGVINIITKKTKTGFNGASTIGYGSFSTNSYKGYLSYGAKKFDIKLGFVRLISNGFTAISPKNKDIQNYEDDKYQNLSTSLKATYNIDDTNKITLQGKTIKTKSDYDSFGNPDDELQNNKSRTTLLKANYKHSNNLATHDIYTKYSKFEREATPSFGATNRDTTDKFDGNIKETGATSRILYLENSFVIFGIENKKSTYNNMRQIDKNQTQYVLNSSYFLTNSSNFDNFVATVSLRQDNYDKFEDKATGKIGIKYNITKYLHINTNYGTAYKVPTLSQMYGQWGANDKLKPENIDSFDTTIAYNNISLSYFDTKIQDQINWVQKYENISGQSHISGYEVDTKKAYGDILLSLGYTNIVKAQDTNKHTLGRVPKESLKYSLDYYGFTDTHIGLNGEYVGSRYDRNYSWTNTPTKYGSQTGKYAIHNININHKIDDDIKIFAKISNLFDKKYQTVDGYATTPIAYYGGLKFKF
ncbi:MAG: TonB-dependent receptor [Epsilonproteobacteria bacterium]|nr:MAG: TonB-dependent receptor [Campylobacterota bacterium]